MSFGRIRSNDILNRIVEELLDKLVEKNVITYADGTDIITNAMKKAYGDY